MSCCSLTAMRLQLLVATALAGGCLSSERDIVVTFQVIDTTGAPRPDALADCGGECDDDSFMCFLDGEVERLGDGRHRCTVSDAADAIWLTATAGDAHVETISAARDGERTLVLWVPLVTSQEVGEDVVLSWDPPAMAAEASGGELRVVVTPDIVDVGLELDATSIAVPREDFEDFAAAVRFEAEQRIGTTTHDHWIDATEVAHTPIVPPSRGAPCTVSFVDGVGGPAPETRTYDAGACPLTDGDAAAFECEGGCHDLVAVVDLGSEQLVRRVRVRGAGGTVAVSTDGVAFGDAGSADEELSPPVAARYVRVTATAALGEISVFSP